MFNTSHWRRWVQRWLLGRAVITRPGPTNAYGGPGADVVAATDVPCRVLVRRGGESRRLRVALPYGTDVRGGDRLVVEGVTFDVVTVQAALTDGVDVQAVIERA